MESKTGKRIYIRIGSPPAELSNDGDPLFSSRYPGIPYFDTKFRIAELMHEAGMHERLAYITVAPTAFFGFGADHGELEILTRYIDGFLPFIPDTVTNAVPATNVAKGTLLAARKGRIDGLYQLAGRNVRMSMLIKKVIDLAGRRRSLPVIPFTPFQLNVMARTLKRAAQITFWPFGKTPPPELDPLSPALMATMGKRSSHRAEDELGYEPGTTNDLVDALREQVTWYQDAGMIKGPTRRVPGLR